MLRAVNHSCRLSAFQRYKTSFSCFSTFESPGSNRKAFKTIDLDRNILDRLDAMKVGFISKRKMKVAVAKKFDKYTTKSSESMLEDRTPLPFPFRATGRVLHTAGDRNEFPIAFPGNPPEVALIGRSNVGKSTLLNALLGFDQSYVQKAIVSDKPGETKFLTFFQLGMSYKPPSKKISSTNTNTTEVTNMKEEIIKTPALIVADMPGYGFAFMNEEEKFRCHTLCLDYLVSNLYRDKALKRVILLLDGRHGLKATDILFLQDLQKFLLDRLAEGEYGSNSEEAQRILDENPGSSSEASLAPEYDDDTMLPMGNGISLTGKQIKMFTKVLGWKLQIVLTKCDLVERTELCRRIISVSRSIEEKVPSLYHSMLPVMALSAMDLRGTKEMKRELAALIPPQWENAPNLKKQELDPIKLEEKELRRQAYEAKKAPNKRKNDDEKEENRPSFSERHKQREEEVKNGTAIDLQRRIFDQEEEYNDYKKGKYTLTEGNKSSSRLINNTSSNTIKKIEPTLRRKDQVMQALHSNNNETTEKNRSFTKESSASSNKKIDIKSTRTTTTKPIKGSPKSQIMAEYGDEIEEYFGDPALQEYEADDLSGLVNSDEEDDYGDADFEDDDFGDADYDEEGDDEGVNWRAAGEDDGRWSDDEEEELQAAMLAGELGGYRRQQVFTGRSGGRTRGGSVMRTNPSPRRSGGRGSSGKGEGRGNFEQEDSRRGGGRTGGGGRRSNTTGSRGNTDSRASTGGKYSQKDSRSGSNRSETRSSSPKSSTPPAGAAPVPLRFRRIPRTPDNPKGRHRLHKAENDHLIGQQPPHTPRGKFGAKPNKSTSSTKPGNTRSGGNSSAKKSGGSTKNNQNKGGSNNGVKKEKAPRRRYY